MGISNMKLFLIRIAIFFGIVAILDIFLGVLFYFLQANVSEGRTKAEYYVCEKATEDVIIMGSSRASHHYVSNIVSDELGLSCFNAGQDGNGIVLQYGRWKMLSERYAPKLIIYDVTPSFDICQNDNITYVDRLKPFSYHEIVRSYIADLFPLERLKIHSKMYCYNYKFLEMLSDCTKRKDNKAGYLPLYGHIREEVVTTSSQEIKQITEDSVKLHYLKEFARECKTKGTELVFVVSPSFRGRGYNLDSFRPVQIIAQELEIPFLFYYDSEFSNNARLFKDSSHLNNEGAELFTKEIIRKIEI